MINVTDATLEPLRSLPFVRAAEWRDGVVAVRLPDGVVRYRVAGLHAAADLSAPPAGADRWLVLADRIGPRTAQSLRARGLEFLDRGGNLSVQHEDRYSAWVEGRRAPRPRRPRGLRGAAYRVLYAALVRQFLREETLRGAAELAGVSTTAVANLWRHLEDSGQLLTTSAGRVLADPRAAARSWLVGYRDLVRPRLVLGRARLPGGGAVALARTLDAALKGSGRWGWGGHIAAGILRQDPDAAGRGPRWLVHVEDVSTLEALPLEVDPSGEVIVVATPGPLGLHDRRIGGHLVAHPLLVWTELRIAGDPRSEEIADDVERDWGWTWNPRG